MISEGLVWFWVFAEMCAYLWPMIRDGLMVFFLWRIAVWVKREAVFTTVGAGSDNPKSKIQNPK